MQSVYEIADLHPLTRENSLFAANGDFVEFYTLENGEKTDAGIILVKRAFPFEAPEEFIVISDEEGRDLGFIRALSERSAEEQALLRRELQRRYFMPVIEKIGRVNDRFGFSYWNVETDRGHMEFSVKDTYKSIIHLGRRMIVTDADGNRYDIPDVFALDRASRKKIDLYIG